MANNTLGGTINSLRQQPWLKDPPAGDAPWLNDPEAYSAFEAVPDDQNPIVGTIDDPAVGTIDDNPIVGQLPQTQRYDYSAFEKVGTPEAPWANDPVVAHRSQGYAATFADQRDLENYRAAKASGATEEQALLVGDNGIGSKDLGTITTSQSYGVAVPREQLLRHFGPDPAAWRKARAMVTVNGQRVTVPIVDEGPGSTAQGRGVVADLTGPLAYALGSNGFNPVDVSLVRNAGPDYTADRAAWHKEQQQIISRLPRVAGYAGFESVDQEPWANDPIVGQLDGSQGATQSDNNPIVGQLESPRNQPQQPTAQGGMSQEERQAFANKYGFDPTDPTGEAAKGTMAGEGPGTHGNRVQDVTPQAMGAYDYSAFTPVGDETHDYSAFVPAQQQQPTEEATTPSKPGGNGPVEAWQNLFASGSEASATLDAHAALDDLNRAKSGIGRGGVFEPIRKAQDDELLANPNTPKEDKDRIISMRDNQILAEQDAAQKQYDQKTKEAAATAAAAPGPEYQKTIPGIVTSFVGQQAPFLLSGGLGPLAPALLGIQMSEASYGDNFDSNKQKLKTLNPGWSDGQIDAVADKTAREASQASFETGVVAGLLPVPKVGPLVQRMVQMMGFRGAYMVVAGAAQDIQDNLATKKYVDPKQAIYDGILAHMPANFAMGAAFEAVPALGEIGRGDRSIVRVAPSGEEIAPSNKAPAEEGPLTVGEQPKPTFPGYVVPPAQTPQEGDKVAPVEENGEGVTVEPNEDQEAGRTTEPTTQATPGNGQAEPGGVSPLAEAPQAGQPKVPWLALFPEDQQRVADQVAPVLRRSIDQYRPLFNALGVQIIETRDPDMGAAVVPSNNGSVFNVNPSAYTEGVYNDWVSGGTHYADRALANDTVEHELIHSAWIDAQHQRWLKSNQSQSWLAFHYDQAAKIDEALQAAIKDARAKGNHQLADILQRGTESGIELYNYGDTGGGARMSPGMRAAEIVRQLVQLKIGNRMTEDFNQGAIANLVSHIGNYFETARARLVDLWNHVSGKATGVEELKRAVDETSQRLAEIGYLKEAGQPPERTTPTRPEEYTPGKEETEPDWNVPADWEQQRREHEREMLAEAQGGQSEILAGVQKAGGLPTPGAIKKGDYFLAAEIQRVHDAWKALDQDSKNWLKKQGVMPSKLFRNDAPGVDEMRGRLEQQPGLNYEQPAGLLDDVEEAIRLARDRKLKFGERYTAPRRTVRPEEYTPGKEGYTAPRRPEEYAPGKGLAYHGPGRLAEKGLLPNREAVEMQPHTEELVKGIDEFRAREGELHGRVAQLNHLFKSLMKRNPRLDREIDQIGRYAEKNRALPAQMSPEARIWLQHANNGLYRDIGDRMRQGGFKTVLPDGSTRPFIGAPPDALPLSRVMRPDVARILQEPLIDKTGNFTKGHYSLIERRYLPGAHELYQEGLQAGFFKKPEDLTGWARQYRLDHPEGAMKTNLERARVTKYPSFFYTYSPQAMLDRLFWQSTELARLESFGQKLAGSKDLFDKTADKINADMSLGDAKREHAFKAIEALRRTVYGQNKRGAGIRLVRGLISAGLAGSPHTTAKIWLSMFFNVPQYRGLGRTLLGIFDHVFAHSQSVDYLRSLGLKQDVSINIHDDPYSVQTAERRASNIFTGILRKAGHALAQDNAKAITAQVSRRYIQAGIKQLQADPNFTKSRTKMFAEDIQRRGMDPKVFTQGAIDPKLIDRFVREDVNDIQTAYRPEDYPAWASTQYGSIAFQFGHWAYNSARTIVRDAVLPMAQAYGRGDVALGTRYFGRLVGISLAGLGAAEAWRELDQLFGRPVNVATIGEIMKAFTRNSPEAAHLLVSRLVQDTFATPVTGLFGDVGNVVRDVPRGTAGETHFFNPTSPAAVGWLYIITRAINKASQQGWKLSNRQKSDAVNQLAGLMKGYADVANTAGLPIPGHSEAMGRREISFVKSRLDLFYDSPEGRSYGAKLQKGGTFSGNPNTPYLQDINEALVSGNVAEARRIAQALRRDQGLTQQQLNTTLRQSLGSHRPVPTGTGGDAFMRWARRSLTTEELTRVRQIERVYETTAQRAGLPVRPEEDSGSTPLASAINSLRGP